MAYPASTKTLQMWLADVDLKAANLKAAAQQQKSLSSAGTLSMDDIRRFFDLLVQANVFITSAGNVTGFSAYVNTEKQGTVADAAAEFLTMRNQVTATLDWLRANVPQGTFGGTDYKLAFNFPTNNTSYAAALTFSSGQTAGYRTVLDALIATIG